MLKPHKEYNLIKMIKYVRDIRHDKTIYKGGPK